MLRRNALLVPLLLCTAKVGSAKSNVIDRRLFGLWRSDRDRTLAGWKFSPSASPEGRNSIAAMFGKMEHRFTPGELCTTLDQDRFCSKYKVIESGDNFVLLQFNDGKAQTLERFFFDGTNWLFLLVGKNIEYFRRVEA